jgi:2,4-dienoyl-CoA reductase (NADPH2)
MPSLPHPAPAEREVFLLQRKDTKIGETLGKTTGWIHRATLKACGVVMLNGVRYDKIDDHGLHVTRKEESFILDVDTVIICAGQEPCRDMYDQLQTGGRKIHLIGGAERAVELDAKRAIDQGCRLAARL